MENCALSSILAEHLTLNHLFREQSDYSRKTFLMFLFFDPAIHFNLGKNPWKYSLQGLCPFSSPLFSAVHSLELVSQFLAGWSFMPTPPPPPEDSSQPKPVPETGTWSWSSEDLVYLGCPCAFRKISRVNNCFESLELLTTCGTLMAPGRGCFALAILLASVDIQLSGEESPSPGPQCRQPSGRIRDSWGGRTLMTFFWWGRKRPSNERVENEVFPFC